MNRRTFLQTTAAGVASTVFQNSVASAATTTRPNILVILADDMGFSDLGCYGSEINTPNLNRLASQGLRFTHFYNAARCCPTRASLLTGLYPHQAGVGKMVSAPGADVPKGPYQGYLNDKCVTIAEVLRGAGYKTYMSGKWHVGEAAENWPRKRGFDRYYGLVSGGSSYWEILEEERGKRILARDDEQCEPEGDDFYLTDEFSEYATRFIDEHQPTDAPFFMYLAYTAPHWPLHAWPEDIARYKGQYDIGWEALRERRHKRMLELGIVESRWPLSPLDPEVPEWAGFVDKADMALRMAVYAAMIDRMDQGIGRVLDAVKRSGQEDNTLVMFLSDNGGCHESVEGRKLHKPGTLPGERGSFVAYKRPWANASNTPFRMFKHWTHEGGIATPLIARWPSRIKQHGELTHQVGHVVDLMATCCDVAGAQYPNEFNGRGVTPLEGKSLLPILDGNDRAPHDTICWEHFGNRAIRDPQWKLVAKEKGDWELYDLIADRTELNNLASAEPKRAEEMYRKWQDWADRCGVAYT